MPFPSSFPSHHRNPLPPPLPTELPRRTTLPNKPIHNDKKPLLPQLHNPANLTPPFDQTNINHALGQTRHIDQPEPVRIEFLCGVDEDAAGGPLAVAALDGPLVGDVVRRWCVGGWGPGLFSVGGDAVVAGEDEVD